MDLLQLINSENWKMLRLYLSHFNNKEDFKKDKDQNTLLHIIAKKKVTWDYNLIDQLKKHININERNLEGKTALHFAIQNNNVDTAEQLITNGAQVDLVDKRGYAPVYYATIGGNIKMLQLLCLNGVDLRWKDSRGETIVHHAARYDLRSMIAFFIKSKTDLNSLNKCGQTPLDVAISSRNTEVALVLIGAGANIKLCNPQEGSLLHKSIKMSNYEVSRLLANTLGVAICDPEGRTPLHLAVEDKQLKLTKLLLDFGASLNCSDVDGYTPLHVVVQNGSLDILDLFIKHARIDEQSIDDYPFSKDKLDYSKKTNAGDNILHLLAASNMAEKNKLDMFHTLLRLDLRMLVVQTNKDFRTPLHFAYQVFCRPLIAQLVNMGADVEEIDRFGRVAKSYCMLQDVGRNKVVKKDSFGRKKATSTVL